MSETKWTPGPWYATQPAMGFADIRSRRTGELVFAVAHPSTVLHDPPMSEEEKQANLTCATAAPELYAACQTVIEFLDGLENCDEDDPLWAIRRRVHAPLRAVLGLAVAKARGEA